MAYASVTWSLSNGTVTDATKVNTNFTDIVNGLSDGSKSLNMDSAVFAGTLAVAGNFTLNTNKFSVVAASGNTAIAGTLGVTGAATLSSTLALTGDLAINTNKFSVAAASGNTLIAGTLGVTGAITGNLTGNVTGDVTGNVTGSSGSCTGLAATATALATARTIGGVSFDGTANITVATATGGFTVSGGNLALTTNSITLTGSIGSTGARVAAGWFTDITCTNNIAANLTGNVTGNCSGTAATVTGAAQAAITSVGTLSTLTVSGAITGATATNTINGVIINSGAVSGVTTLATTSHASIGNSTFQTWESSYTSLKVGSNAVLYGLSNNAATSVLLGNNVFINAAGTNKRIGSGFATRLWFKGADGDIAFQTATSSGADTDITFITPLLLSNTGLATFAGRITTTDTTEATTTSNGSIAGAGLSLTKAIYAGGDLTVLGSNVTLAPGGVTFKCDEAGTEPGSQFIFRVDNATRLSMGSGAATFTIPVITTQYKLSALNTAPANAGATGTLGEIRVVADAIYVCTATNTWVKAALATWS